MGKTSALFASSLPRLASGIVYSADSGFRAQIKAGASERERVYASDLAEYVDRDTAMLRAHTVFKLSEKLGVGVEQFSFGLYRFCAVEPSYVVVLAPMLDDQVFDDWLMPVTKQEKQLMVRNGSGLVLSLTQLWQARARAHSSLFKREGLLAMCGVP